MNKNEYKPRIIDKRAEDYLSAFGAVCIEGPKWCGKTWTSSYHSKSEISLADPSHNFQNRKLAEMSPDLVLQGASPRLIDEWQEVPPIWDAVRYEVDKSDKKGLFILTGSATPRHKGILHSGAGRIARLRMRPMSLWEAGWSSGAISLESLCRGKISAKMTGEVSLPQLAELIVRGGWPAGLTLPSEKAALLAGEYIDAIINDDIYRMDGVRRDIGKIYLLLRSLARNESTMATNRTLAKDIKAVDDVEIDGNTVSVYLDIFRRLFLTENQAPFSPGVRSAIRVKQSEKRHFVDPSLACALLGLTPDGLIGDLETFGFLFESLCERDLRIYAESFGAELYHYHDYKDQEIDAVIGLPDGEWCAFEIKLGVGQIDVAAHNLLKIKAQFIEKPPKTLCVICGLSTAAYRRDDGVFVVPITALKE